MVDWLAGKRVRGTSSERSGFGVGLGGTGVGGWVELARTTLGSGSTTINVNTLANKRYYMILYNSLGQSTSADPNWTFNADTGSNYADRFSINGGSDSTGTSQSNIFAGSQPAGDYDAFSVNYLANYSSKEKLWISHYTAPTIDGATEAPMRTETVAKWSNTSNAFDEITLTSSATLTTGGEVVVLGYDPADTHTTNFWEELASVEASGSSTNLSTGTFTAKKYLWVQVYLGAVAGNVGVTFNNDTGANYARRFSQKGGADSTDGSQSNFTSMMGIGNTWASFSNNFIINNASNEKLVISHMNYAVGTGAINDPERMEFVGKWANTSNQITEIDFDSTSGNFPTSSIIKVWGAD